MQDGLKYSALTSICLLNHFSHIIVHCASLLYIHLHSDYKHLHAFECAHNDVECMRMHIQRAYKGEQRLVVHLVHSGGQARRPHKGEEVGARLKLIDCRMLRARQPAAEILVALDVRHTCIDAR